MILEEHRSASNGKRLPFGLPRDLLADAELRATILRRAEVHRLTSLAFTIEARECVPPHPG